MKQSDRTKQCKNLSLLFGILHFLCLFGPLLYYIPYAFASGETGQKLGLSLFAIVAICLMFLAIISEAATRAGLIKSMLWLLILGITMCLTEAKTFIYVMAIVSVVDELIIIKLKDHYKNKYSANVEIDRRQV